MVTKTISKSPEVQKIVNNALNSGQWKLERAGGKDHGRLRHEPTGRLVVFGSTVSDTRAFKNLARDIRHVEAGMPGWGMSKEITKPVALKRNQMYA